MKKFNETIQSQMHIGHEAESKTHHLLCSNTLTYIALLTSYTGMKKSKEPI